MAKKQMPKRARTSGGATAAPKIHRRQTVMAIRVGLAPDEREPLVKELTSKITSSKEVKAEAAEIQAGYRRKLKEMQEQIDELCLKLEQGIPEDTEVEEIKDFGKGTVTILRLDTRAVVIKRDMTEEDRQLDLGGAPDLEPVGDDQEQVAHA